jgi:hypothetical protein
VSPATLDSILPYIELLDEQAAGVTAPVFALAEPDGYDGAEQLLLRSGRYVDVRWCASELAMREALLADQAPERGLVLLTPVTTVGADLAGRLVRRHVVRPNRLDALAAAFDTPRIDPAIPDWLVERLVDLRPPDGYPRSGARLLSLDRAWEVYLERALGLDPSRGLRGLLPWVAGQAASRWMAETEPVRSAVVAHLRAAIPGAGGPLAALASGRGSAVVSLGLVARVLADASADAARAAARVRFEVLLGGWAFDDPAARRWAAVAEEQMQALLTTDAATGATRLTEADNLVDELQASALAGTSVWLRCGLRARQAALGAALDIGQDVEAAAASVAAHELAPDGAALVARLAVRLHRWLAHDRPTPGSLLEAARQHVADDAYADYARTLLRFGGDQVQLDEALRRLVARVDERRVSQDGRFAELLAAWSIHSETTTEMLGVEDVLGAVVGPLAAQRRVLVVVLDGMSHRVAVELVDDALQRGWTELRRVERPERALVLSALPSVTQFARASLLSGELRHALASDERVAFADHPALLRAGGDGPAPVLFHKGALRHPSGGLADEVREAVHGRGRVVGAVVNAIDDHLARSEQMRSHWSIRDVPPLSWLLTAAREADRLVVLLADHGHVIERGGQMRARGVPGGERWASAEREPQPGELLVEGTRVLVPGGKAVLCWDERVRFSPPKHGYHGGASPQEVLVPTVVLAPGLVEGVDGWTEAPYDPPAWWTAAPTVAAPPAGPAGQLRLDAPPQTPTHPVWLGELLAGDVLAEQRRRHPRPAVGDETLRAVLGSLASAGGTLLLPALAQAVALSPQRLRGTLAAISMLVNVDGYQALEVDDGSDTVRLHQAVLAEQFGT